MANTGHSIANASGFFLKYKAEAEGKTELEEYVDEKMDIVGDFFDKKHQPSKEELNNLRNEMLSETTKVGIDNCFRRFLGI